MGDGWVGGWRVWRWMNMGRWVGGWRGWGVIRWVEGVGCNGWVEGVGYNWVGRGGGV